MNKEEKKLIPELRFPGFKEEEEWKEKALKDLSKKVLLKNKDGLIDTVFSNSAIDGIVDQREYFDRDIADKNNLENYYLVEPGDYVYNPRVSNAAPVGPISKNKTSQIGAMSPLYTVFRFDDKNNDFYEHYFKSNHWYESIKKASNTGARFDRMSITDSVFMDIPVLYPHPQEQQKIASCLSSLDEVITAHSQKLELLKEHKKGLMQNLFPQEGEKVPKYRFRNYEDKWRKDRLINHIDLVSGFAFKSEFFSDRGQKLITPKNFTKDGYPLFNSENTKYTTEEYDKKYICSENDLLLLLTDLTPSCELLGKPVMIRKDDKQVLLNQRIVKVIPKSDLDKNFLLQFFLTNLYHTRIVSTATGSTVRHSSNKIILDTELMIPEDPREQKEIGYFLSGLDEIIKAQIEKIEQLKLHKKGLMQGMFPKV